MKKTLDFGDIAMKTDKKTQAGRSMVEILGVIAIIGVLTAGGLGGFNWAMNKYRAYRIVNGTEHRVMMAGIRRRAGQGVNRYKDQIEASIMNYGVAYDSEYTNADLDVSNGKKIVVSNISDKVCEMLKEDSGLVAVRDLTPAKVLINGTLLENNPVCLEGEIANTLSVVMNPNVRIARELPGVDEKSCVFDGKTYESGKTVGTCGECVDGVIQVDWSKIDDCKVCKTDTWSLELKANGLHPITTGAEKDKCCVYGSLKYDAVFCPQGCVVGEVVYADGDIVDSCGKCENGTVTPIANCCKGDNECLSCQTCSTGSHTCEMKSDYTLTDDGTCCPIDDIYIKQGKRACCTVTCKEGETLNKETCACDCSPEKGCCPEGRLLCNLKCCEKGAVCNANTKSCCKAGEVIKNGLCCAEGTQYTNGSTCCAVDAIGVAKNPGTSYTEYMCCDSDKSLVSGYCCPAGTTGWAANESGNNRCCAGTVVDGYCCANENVYTDGSRKYCCNIKASEVWGICDGQCCPSTKPFCETDQATGKKYCCATGDFN